MLVADKSPGQGGSSRAGKGGSLTLPGGRDGEWFRKQLLAETSEEEFSDEEDRVSVVFYLLAACVAILVATVTWPKRPITLP